MDVAVVLELALDREEVVLGVVDAGSSRRGATRAIWRHSSRADRAAGAGDHHDLAVEVGADAVELHPHRLAAEDVLDLHLAHLAHDVAAAACSSSKTVGSVRTGMPRSRHGAARRARAACPAPTGSRSMTSSGSASSRIRAELVGARRARARRRRACRA